MPFPAIITGDRAWLAYATEEEVLAFARKLREAGDGPPLDALVPSKRASAQSCLIANALNFKASVFPMAGVWVMSPELSDEDILVLANAVGCKTMPAGNQLVLVLPEKIGNAARAFDMGIGWTAKYARN